MDQPVSTKEPWLIRRLKKPWNFFRYRLSLPEFEEAAQDSTGLTDFGDPYYRKGLKALTRSLRKDADLNFLGRLIAQRAILLGLKQRLLLQDLRQREPALFSMPLMQPIIVTGLPRTGTTHLHRLLAEDPSARAPPLGELVAPVASSSALRRSMHRARLEIELATLRRMTPGLDAMHPSRLDAPEECMFAMALSFRTMLFWTLAPAYSYMEWYSTANRAKKYRDYRDILRLLQARAPEHRLVLKAPEHLGSLNALFRFVPEALLVVCHRKPAEAVTSFNSLIHALHQTVSEAPDPKRIAETHLAYFSAETENYLAARGNWRRNIIEIDYADLVRDPLAVVHRIYERAGLVVTPELESKFKTFIADNRKDKFGRHTYDPEQFGQSERMLTRHFANYGIEG